MTFSYFKNACISGRMFTDSDGDNTENKASGGYEAGIAGQTVKLLNDCGQVVATTSTNADGAYSFTGLPSGTYTVLFPTSVNGQGLVKEDVGSGGEDSDANVSTGKSFTICVDHDDKVYNVDAGYTVPPAQNPDGPVDGEAFGETMVLGYDDANAPTDGGGDRITEGDDTIYGNGGSDHIEGAGGDDLIYGDDGDGGSRVATEVQDVFRWSELTDRYGGHLSDGEKIVSQTLNTGENSVTLTLTTDYDNTFSTDQQKVHSIDTGGLPGANAYSSLESELHYKGDSQTYTLEFEEDASNLSFRVNDIDFDSTVVIKAYDAKGNPVPVSMTAGSGVALFDNDGVAGLETVVSRGGGDADTSPTYSALVSVPGPIAKLVITHVQDGYNDSGVNITDIYFDTLVDAGPGAPGNDTILGGAGNDVIYGEEGDDKLYGGTGDDLIYGGDGSDYIEGNEGNDTLYGNEDDDRIYGGAGNDTILGQGGTDLLYGGEGDDSILGGRDGDLIQGGAGNDIVNGAAGDDTVYGNDGDDTVIGGGGNDSLYGGAGNDSILGDNNEDYIEGGSGDDEIDGGASDDVIKAGSGNDTVEGGAGDDIIDTTGPLLSQLPDVGYPGLYPADPNPNDDKDVVYGGAGNDTITTGDDDDIIYGGTGNDVIDAGLDDDYVEGGEGDDVITGSEGNDEIHAGAGNDVVYGGLAPGVLEPANLPDDLDGDGDGNDPGEDKVTFNNNDLIYGGDGDDTLYGMDDDDTIYGGTGKDVLYGGVDDDALYGDEGNDTFYGGQGNDEMFGGLGSDTFVGGNGGDVVIGGEDPDLDGDGESDETDTLDLTGSGVDFITYTSADREDGVVTFLDGSTMTFEEIENVIPCFTPGTMIATPRGEKPVEELREGDRVITRDNGIQEIRWIGHKEMKGTDLARSPHLKPVLIKAGSLGNGLPERDMLVSPNHRILVANDLTQLYFEEREVLAAAKHLIGTEGVHAVNVMTTTYIHFMFDNHEVVLSNGAWTESFQPGDYSLKGLGNSQRTELFELFPELADRPGREAYTAARRALKKHEAALLVK